MEVLTIAYNTRMREAKGLWYSLTKEIEKQEKKLKKLLNKRDRIIWPQVLPDLIAPLANKISEYTGIDHKIRYLQDLWYAIELQENGSTAKNLRITWGWNAQGDTALMYKHRNREVCAFLPDRIKEIVALFEPVKEY